MRTASRVLLAALALLVSPALFAADAPKKSTKVPPGVKAITDVQYVPNGDPAQSLDLFLPETPSDQPLPLVVWIHGGGWHGGDRFNPPGMNLIKDGYAVASIEYRFSQKAIFPAQIQDCQAAIRWFRAHGKQYNLDANHIGVWGASAGGISSRSSTSPAEKNSFRPSVATKASRTRSRL